MYGYPESSHSVIETKEQKSLDFKASSCFSHCIQARYTKLLVTSRAYCICFHVLPTRHAYF